MNLLTRPMSNTSNILPTPSKMQSGRYKEESPSGFAGLQNSESLAYFQRPGNVSILKHVLKATLNICGCTSWLIYLPNPDVRPGGGGWRSLPPFDLLITVL